jgi:hypothetical protein
MSVPPSAPELRTKPRWSLALRIAVSLVIAFHVFAVFVGPWAMPQQASPLAADFGSVLRPYVDALYLNNGYRFFAPEPGPSHLIRYELKLADGREVKGQFPDHKVNRPRLLYHRYFMLSEFANTLNIENGPPEAEVVFKLYVRSYARHLAIKYDAKQVKLTLVRHLLPGIDAVRRGEMKLDDPRLYEELPLGTFSGDEL